MYDRKDKRRLYMLIKLYLSSKITEEDFCDEIYYTYDLNIDDETLTSDEKTIFKKLALVTGRFSEFEQDHKKHPGSFFTATDIRRKVIETRKKLQKNFEELEKSGELRQVLAK